jgi:transglutaminase-like putative cysteine protease
MQGVLHGWWRLSPQGPKEAYGGDQGRLYDCPQPTPMMLVLTIHYTRAADMLVPDQLKTDPPVPIAAHRDSFGNWCSRIVAPKGQISSGEPDVVATSAQQHSIQDLPEEALVFLLGSRYCDTEKFSQTAWSLFGQTPPGWGRVQAICDFVHNHISFGYEHARATRTAWETFNERRGVCRDYAHLAIAFCRCMNIPARYCTGYLGDMGAPPPYGPMDFASRGGLVPNPIFAGHSYDCEGSELSVP